ncbi:MAG: hypothetical protein ACXWUG_13300 [Polyangiales bacterium]
MRKLAVACFMLGCSSAEGAAPMDDAFVNADTPSESTADVTSTSDTLGGDGEVEAAVDASPFPPEGTSCEYGFFRKYFDKDNGPGLDALREASFARIVERWKELTACGAKTTLGGLLSLTIYEGGGAKVAFYNDRCAENSYDKSATCWNVPKARYSYQYGLAPIHTSNFHPCADVAYTSKMRARLAKAIGAAGFTATDVEIASVDAQVKTFCPSSTATIVDYFILTTHSKFGVPTDGTGNDLANAGKFPFFTPRVVIDLFFDFFAGSCATLDSDEAAIAAFGGGDASYATPSKQAQILKLWNDYRAATCP